MNLNNLKALGKKLAKSKLTKDAGLYTVFRVADKLIPFFLLPIITRVLNPDEYGVFVLFQAIAGIVLPLMTLSIDSSILLNYFKVKKEKFSSYFSSGYLLLIFSSVITFSLIYLFRNPVSSLIEFPAAWVISILIFCFLQFHSNLALNLFQVKKQPKYYGIYSVSLTATKNLAMLYLVLYEGMKWQGIIVGYILAYSIFFLISFYLFKKDNLFTKNIDKNYIKDNMQVGYPLSIHKIGGWLSDSATRIIVGGIIGTAAAGSFGIGASIALVVKYIQDSFNKAFVPYLFDLLKDFKPETEKKLVRLTYVYNAGLLIFSVLFGLAGVFSLEFVFGSEYANGKEVVLFICLAYAFNGMYKMHVNYIFYTKKTYLITIITIIMGLVNIGTSYLFVKKFGLSGAGLSLCITNFLGYLISWYLGNKVLPMNWLFSSKTKET